MGIFSSIRDAIFGAPEAEAPAAATAAPTGGKMAKQEVDVEAVLAAKAAAKANPLNYMDSIVDLMKALDMDSSYANRKELAEELGIAAYEGSAEQNIALHKAVMRELSKHGGRVPANLLD